MLNRSLHKKYFWSSRRRELGRFGVLRTDKLLILHSVDTADPFYVKLT